MQFDFRYREYILLNMCLVECCLCLREKPDVWILC